MPILTLSNSKAEGTRGRSLTLEALIQSPKPRTSQRSREVNTATVTEQRGRQSERDSLREFWPKFNEISYPFHVDKV